MRNKFLQDLGENLSERGLSFKAIEKILRPYEIHFIEAEAQGKTYEEIVNELESIGDIADKFAPKDVIPIRSASTSAEDLEHVEERKPKKSNGFVLAILILALVLLNVFIFIPVGLGIFAGLIALLAIPFSLGTVAISALLYGATYVNGHLFVLSIVSRIALPLGILGVCIFFLIGLYYLFKYFFKGVAGFSRLQASIFRRNK